VRIATYNVNGVNGRLEVLLRWLKEETPDVVCLQELKAPDSKFPIKPIEAAGYGAVWHGQNPGMVLPISRRAQLHWKPDAGYLGATKMSKADTLKLSCTVW